MLKTTIIAEESLAPKLDFRFVEAALKDAVQDNVFIAFVCVNNDWRKNDTWKNRRGVKMHQIVLPYEKVAGMTTEDVRQWMLRLAQERLGLVKSQVAAAGDTQSHLKASPAL